MKRQFINLSLKEIFTSLSEENPSREIYDYFFNKYYPKLIWFALLYVKQHAAAEEIVSDVMLNLFKNRKKISNAQNIEGYIFIAVKNQALKYIKKNSRLNYLENIESAEDLVITVNATPEHKYVEEEFYQIIKDAIDSLPPKRKLVFRMVKEEGLHYHDVARLLDLSVKTVETHMGLALKTVHECINNYRHEATQTARIYKLKK